MDDPIRILVVDDDTEHRDLVTKWLRFFGYEAVGVSEGKEALGILKDSTVSVVLTDLHMAGMDGLALARMAQEAAPDTSILLCTADWSPQLVEKAKESGVAAVFSKPLNLRRVSTAVGREVERQKTRTECSPRQWEKWTCPVCSAAYVGWSPLNVCYECGYAEGVRRHPTQVA